MPTLGGDGNSRIKRSCRGPKLRGIVGDIERLRLTDKELNQLDLISDHEALLTRVQLSMLFNLET